MATALALSAYDTDELTSQASIDAMRCSPKGPGVLADTLGVCKQRGSQLYDGDRTGFIWRAHHAVGRLAAGEQTTPWPFITSLKVQAMVHMAAGQDSAAAVLRWRELAALEAQARQRAENARDNRNRAAEVQAWRDIAAILEERVALDDVLAWSQIDPREARQ